VGLRIEDYALIGDTHTTALVGNNGSIDWLCVPRFDSGACFAALLGDERNGRWLLRPSGDVRQVRRRYRPGTLVLETDFETESGAVRLVECMPPGKNGTHLVRAVEGLRGAVQMEMELVVRFDYGSVVPWTRRMGRVLLQVAGPDALALHTPIETRAQDGMTVGRFTVRAGEKVPFHLIWFPSYETPPPDEDALSLIVRTEESWREWSAQSSYAGEWSEAVERSLITLKALTYEPTGGIVAAPTTSLPEQIGGTRNWDYRYCWLRDAAGTLDALMVAGYLEEARAWRDWLLRAVAGDPAQIQIMYGVAGERRLTELELPWLTGYENSSPVRIGNAASEQFQLDVYGEVVAIAYQALRSGFAPDPGLPAAPLISALLDFVETAWREPDEGIWEVRGARQHFTHSKVMAWVAMDRAVKLAETFGIEGPLDRWRRLRSEIHEEVCRRGYDAEANTFVQHFGSRELDASLLLLPAFGFLPPDDPRIIGTIEAVQRDLSSGALVDRYSTRESVDGLPGDEGAFLICSFWLVGALALAGRSEEARSNFEQLLALRNDVGLLAEEYDPVAERQVGNFPQAFSHMGVINAANHLSEWSDAKSNQPKAREEII
jgi:GH15 family glucan-1,4-alpha-glucosidase